MVLGLVGVDERRANYNSTVCSSVGESVFGSDGCGDGGPCCCSMAWGLGRDLDVVMGYLREGKAA